MKAIIEKLEAKSKMEKGSRMPSIDKICELLDFYSIKYSKGDSVNIVEKSGSGKALYSRSYGKEGKQIFIECIKLRIDSSDSLYSVKSSLYAYEILKLISEK